MKAISFAGFSPRLDLFNRPDTLAPFRPDPRNRGGDGMDRPPTVIEMKWENGRRSENVLDCRRLTDEQCKELERDIERKKAERNRQQQGNPDAGVAPDANPRR